jgi:hypothetical protein
MIAGGVPFGLSRQSDDLEALTGSGASNAAMKIAGCREIR